MALPLNKTKIVCTIGPASRSPETIEQMVLAGMNVARINFSHGDFTDHNEVIANIREVSSRHGRDVAILADLPGPKIRIGNLKEEPVELRTGDQISLTIDEIQGDRNRVSVNLPNLPQTVKKGDQIFLNDGLIQLEAVSITGHDVNCVVRVGAELRSRKGLNLPGISLGIGAFTDRDYECLRFALDHQVDAVSQSFVESASDIGALRDAASVLGASPFVIAKIERSRALDNIDEILAAADGIMIARGDLGVETPIERIALVQKEIMAKANTLGKPVITATQMLESMTSNRRPTRAESTDVANAILDGTDCVMLSAESATGQYPIDAVATLSRIASATEAYRCQRPIGHFLAMPEIDEKLNIRDLIAVSVKNAVEHVQPAVIFAPTRSGASARSMSRFKLPVWVVAVSSLQTTCRRLQFSYGVIPELVDEDPDDWRAFT
ncbi:MAG: pyruvate kinase, partial [Deltaproteobacteria bacterium]|nr:pyruvate kinase [Deltaproteobacteria bacterium]